MMRVFAMTLLVASLAAANPVASAAEEEPREEADASRSVLAETQPGSGVALSAVQLNGLHKSWRMFAKLVKADPNRDQNQYSCMVWKRGSGWLVLWRKNAAIGGMFYEIDGKTGAVRAVEGGP